MKLNKKTIVWNNENWKMLLIAIIVVVSDDTLLFGTNLKAEYETIKHAILIATLAFLSLYLAKRILFQKITRAGLCCTAMCVLVLLCGIFNNDLRTGYFYKCIILILSCEITATISLKEFAQKFEKLLFVLAVISVIGTAIAKVNVSVFSFMPIFYNSAYNTFYNFVIYLVPTTQALVRNYGIFREPGVYQMFLILALLFHTYYADKIRVGRLIVYILAVVLTFSTTGYIALALFLVLFLIKKKEYVSEKERNLLIGFFLLGGLYMLTQTDLLSSDGMVFDKFTNPQRTTIIARLSSVFTNLEIWKQSPIIGAGLIKVSEQFPIITYEMYGRATTHNTNTLLCELATYGIIYTGILVYGYIKFSKALSGRMLERIMILLIVLVLSVGEKLTFSPIIFILLFYGILFQEEMRQERVQNESFTD